MNKKNVVVLGGGHGQSVILRGLKYINNIHLSAIVTVADDGGSTGRLRRQFHIPAMGDIRNVLISLAESETLLKSLMEFRFDGEDNSNQDVQGHNLGNLILTAMTQSSGSFMESIATLSKVLNVRGDIIPSTSQVITLYARMVDGTIVRGEANIPDISNRIETVFYAEDVRATKQAVEAIQNADIIIYGIGSIYTSILPNIIIEEIKTALKKSKALKIYFCNAMSQPGETDGYEMEDHADALTRHGAEIDLVVAASDEVPQEILNRYAEEGSSRVHVREQNHDYKLWCTELLDFSNNLIRHDASKIQKSFEEILNQLEGKACPSQPK